MAGSGARNGLAVVHLVVRELGIDYFRAFVRSYRAHDAGAEHTLILALKQFDDEVHFKPYCAELQGIAYRIIHVPDSGHDIGSYVAIATTTHFQIYCFINSKTELITQQWLGKLAHGHEANPDGITGATGSWQSLASDALKYAPHGRPAVLMNLRRVLGYLWLRRRFPKFPNPHIRTNVFLVGRDTFLALDFGGIGSKTDTWKLESGRNSLSRQIQARGGELLVIDNQGKSYSPGDWPDSATFWHKGQLGLLSTDRQTRIFREANAAEREAMTAEAWEKPRLPRTSATLICAVLALTAAILGLVWLTS